MSSEKHIERMKHQARLLEVSLEQDAQFEINHTAALELVARIIYGYKHWNVACGNSPDREPATTYSEFVNQVAQLVNEVPVFQIKESDLEFTDGIPNIVQKDFFHLPAGILAAVYLEEEFSYNRFFELVQARYIPENYFSHLPKQFQPTSAYMAFQQARIHIEFDGAGTFEYGNYPWDQWAKKMEKKGELSPDLIASGRMIYRECIQHSWDLNLVLLCGGFDKGVILERILTKWPEKSLAVIDYLLETDGCSS